MNFDSSHSLTCFKLTTSILSCVCVFLSVSVCVCSCLWLALVELDSLWTTKPLWHHATFRSLGVCILAANVLCFGVRSYFWHQKRRKEDETPSREDQKDKLNNIVIPYVAGLSEKLKSLLQASHPSVLQTQLHTQTKTDSSQRQNS